jgi:3-oxoacyl-[acyl-carrier protein] reductase
MDFGLKNKLALVCGASKGLGRATAVALAGEGCRLILVARDEQALDDVSKLARAAGSPEVQVHVVDLSRPAEREALLSVVPSPDVLITNAGGPPGGDFRNITAQQWEAALQTNFLSAVDLIRGVVDGMAARSFGRIVNITSMTVRTAVRHLELSNASRLALTGYVAGLSREMAAAGVTMNNVLPGPIATERIQALGDTARQLIKKVPIGRAGRPEEFAATCAFLCSQQAGYITGQNILVDGGLCDFTV